MTLITHDTRKDARSYLGDLKNQLKRAEEWISDQPGASFAFLAVDHIVEGCMLVCRFDEDSILKICLCSREASDHSDEYSPIDAEPTDRFIALARVVPDLLSEISQFDGDAAYEAKEAAGAIDQKLAELSD